MSTIEVVERDKDMTTTELIAANLKGELARQNRTQKDVADLLGFSANTATSRFKGHTPFTTTELEKIGGMLGMDLYQLMTVALRPINAINAIRA